MDTCITLYEYDNKKRETIQLKIREAYFRHKKNFEAIPFCFYRDWEKRGKLEKTYILRLSK